MPYRTVIGAKGRPAARPAKPDELLLHPITSNPDAANATNDNDWAREHAARPRFYVGGQSWFRDLTGLGPEQLSTYRDAAIKKSQKLTWASTTGNDQYYARQLQKYWQNIARQQYYDVAGLRPVLFPKAGLFVLSCELALKDLIENPGKYPNLPAIPTGRHAVGRL